MKANKTPASLRLAAALVLAAAWLPGAAWADTKVRVSSFEYDATGLLVKEVIEPDLPNDCLQTTHTYDTFGNRVGISTSACTGATGDTLLSATTPRTATTTFGTDGRFPLASTNALGQSESKAYDSRFGAVTSLTGPNALTTSWQYDGFGRKTRENRADGTYTTWAYLLCSAAGANCPGPIGGAASAWVMIEQTFAAGVTSAPEKRQFHDMLGRVVRVQTLGFDAGQAPVLVQDTEYNHLGQVARKSNVYQAGTTAHWTQYIYDALGRVKEERAPDPAASGGVAVTAYQFNGLVTTITNSKGQTRTTTKNTQGLVAEVRDAEGNVVLYTYDALGQLTRTEAAGVSVTTMTYNRRGQKIAMADLTMGAWEYRYNAFGELVWQRDSQSQVTTMMYDALGRVTQRTEPDLVSQWSYDKKFDGSACGKGIGKLCEATANNGYRRLHTYDNLGRPSSTSTVLDNPAAPAVVSVAFDASGRLASKTWPTGYQATYQYTALGFLQGVTGGGNLGFPAVSYQVLDVDAQGHITRYRQGSQVTTVRTFDGPTGRLLSQVATTDGQSSGGVLHQAYAYDSLSNLTTRVDQSVGTSESFSYDALNRLSQYDFVGGGVSPPRSTQVKYDARGNILYKSDVGRYWYDNDRPNRLNNVTLETAPGATVAVTGTRALSYVYNDDRPGAQMVMGRSMSNGNLEYTVSQDLVNNRHTYRGETYTSFNMPLQINFGNFVNGSATTADRVLSFVYGPEHQRIKQQVQLTSGAPTTYSAGTTWYLNGEDNLGLTYEKEVKDNGITEHKHYVSGGGAVFALYTHRTGNLNGAAAHVRRYFQHDHLGSIAVVTDEMGQVVERMAYDPWGKRRHPNGVNDVTDSIVGVNTDRGFTMHEHLDEIGVIHMNGRIFDPLIGRFMSADPYIQAADNLQSFNRYAYVMNNPLNATDPSGYWSFKKFFKASVKHALLPMPKTTNEFVHFQPGMKQVENAVLSNPTLYQAGRMIAGAVTTAFTGWGWGAAAWDAYFGYAATGSTTAGLKAGAPALATAALFYGAGEIGGMAGEYSFSHYAAHAVAGCLSSAASGGDCGRGAASGIGGLAGTNLFGANIIGAAAGGGIGSVLSGGSFSDGAVTGAFGYLFNRCAHSRDCWDQVQRGTVMFFRQALEQYSSALGEAGIFAASTITPVGATVRTGMVVERTFATAKGPVEFMAEAVVTGDRLILKDAVLYGRSEAALTGMTRDLYRGMQEIREWAATQGFRSLEITGVRAANSTSARPGSTWSKSWEW